MAQELADQLLADIRRRGLSSGDRYLTTREVGRMLGVRKATANRALQLLADERYLVRKQRSGTFVGPEIKADGSIATRRTVHVLLCQGRGLGAFSCDEFMAGIQQSLPGASVQFNFLPERDPLAFLDRLIQEVRSTTSETALVPVSCPREVYRFLMDQRLPLVVLGSLFPDVDTIPSVDGDYAQAGKLVIEYLAAQGRRRIGLVMYQTWQPGDNALLEGMGRGLAETQLPANSLLVRSVPNEPHLVEGEVLRLLEAEDRPTALVLRNHEHTRIAEKVANSLGLKVPQDLLLLSEGRIPVTYTGTPGPCLVRRVGLHEVANTVGKMLLQQITGEELSVKHPAIPFEIQEPVLGSANKIV